MIRDHLTVFVGEARPVGAGACIKERRSRDYEVVWPDVASNLVADGRSPEVALVKASCITDRHNVEDEEAEKDQRHPEQQPTLSGPPSIEG